MSESPELGELAELLGAIHPFIIVSPPRSASTALARAFFNHSQFHTYVHEPCGELYHERGGIASVLRQFRERAAAPGHTLVKFMSFQLGDGELAKLVLQTAGAPPLFPLRDPTLSIESRLRRVLVDLGDSGRLAAEDRERVSQALTEHHYAAIDALVSERYLSSDQMGVAALDRQVAICDELGIPFVLVDAHELRTEPESALRELCSQWNLALQPEMLHWRDEPFPDHGVLTEQARWFERVSRSQTFLPPNEQPIALQSFPAALQPAVREAQATYEQLSARSENVLRHNG